VTTRPGVILWLTGLPCAGKSTLARALGPLVAAAGPTEILDGDEVRAHLSKGLGYSREDRDTNIRRIGYVARLLARHGVFVITAVISPYARTRDEIRREAERYGVHFIEVFVSAGLETVVARDVKGMYRRALAGELPSFTGVSDPYEPPSDPEIVVRTDQQTVEESVETILRALVTRGLLPARTTA
jgi:adenylyl-sulfate kinase